MCTLFTVLSTFGFQSTFILFVRERPIRELNLGTAVISSLPVILGTKPRCL